jgi:hypothetical protein
MFSPASVFYFEVCSTNLVFLSDNFLSISFQFLKRHVLSFHTYFISYFTHHFYCIRKSNQKNRDYSCKISLKGIRENSSQMALPGNGRLKRSALSTSFAALIRSRAISLK